MGLIFSEFSKLGSGAKPPSPNPTPSLARDKPTFRTHPLFMGWLRHCIYENIGSMFLLAKEPVCPCWCHSLQDLTYITSCLSLIKSALYPNLVIFISETSVEFVIFFLFLQPQLLRIHLSPANLTTAIHYTQHLTNKSQQTSTHSKFIGTCHYKYFKISTHHTNTQKTTLASYQTKNRQQNLSSHIQNTYKSTT